MSANTVDQWKAHFKANDIIRLEEFSAINADIKRLLNELSEANDEMLKARAIGNAQGQSSAYFKAEKIQKEAIALLVELERDKRQKEPTDFERMHVEEMLQHQKWITRLTTISVIVSVISGAFSSAAIFSSVESTNISAAQLQEMKRQNDLTQTQNEIMIEQNRIAEGSLQASRDANKASSKRTSSK